MITDQNTNSQLLQATLSEAAAILNMSYHSLKKRAVRHRLQLEDIPRPSACLDHRLRFVSRASLDLAASRLQQFRPIK